MKRILALLLALVMTFGLFACGVAPLETTGPVETLPVLTQPAGDNSGSPDHVGVVIGIEKDEILAVEGNYDNAVKLRRFPVDWEKLRGFVCPVWEEEQMIYHTMEEVPAYARPTIEKLVSDGSLLGIAEDDLGLTDELLRTLVILDRLGRL